MRGLVGPRAALDTAEHRKISLSGIQPRIILEKFVCYLTSFDKRSNTFLSKIDVVVGDAACPQSCSLATAVVLSCVYAAVT
jgi:hypothetical protein